MLDKTSGSYNSTVLIILSREKDEVPFQRDMRALQNEHGHELRDCLALHIERAAPPDVAVLDHATEWVHAPVLRRCEHDVHVIEKDHRSGAAVARQAGVEVCLPRRGLENSRLDTIASQ